MSAKTGGKTKQKALVRKTCLHSSYNFFSRIFLFPFFLYPFWYYYLKLKSSNYCLKCTTKADFMPCPHDLDITNQYYLHESSNCIIHLTPLVNTWFKGWTGNVRYKAPSTKDRTHNGIIKLAPIVVYTTTRNAEEHTQGAWAGPILRVTVVGPWILSIAQKRHSEWLGGRWWGRYAEYVFGCRKQ